MIDTDLLATIALGVLIAELVALGITKLIARTFFQVYHWLQMKRHLARWGYIKGRYVRFLVDDEPFKKGTLFEVTDVSNPSCAFAKLVKPETEAEAARTFMLNYDMFNKGWGLDIRSGVDPKAPF